ncbi:hypothetical protein [Legionella waltersii]|uniref:Serine/threonine protein kinase n=1 Tax=Legionella waltersii TaxID=66969 RepID=A0A0W1ACD1_9GAMM|nr:hypothetical protein [Legionella waltersii]KTD78832.1 serine/threonine protein kinase [Legionella waltersii]SNV10915.1 serine/threonine protein kinase [Legionella waltersii]
MLSKLLTVFKKEAKLPPKKPMPNLSDFKHGALPRKDMDKFTKDINRLIDQYNNQDEDSSKINTLKEIQKKIQEVDYKYQASQLARSPGYQSAHDSLFKDIQYQYSSLGISSLSSPKKSSSLPEVIANMSPEKTNQLLSILMKGKEADLDKELKDLYQPTDDSKEAKAFNQFLKEHEISFLGGGNSKNFKVKRIKDGTESVLKVDNRLNMPRNVESHLREKLGDKFAPIDAERTAIGKDSEGKPIHRTILVTEFCKGGSIDKQRQQLTTVVELVENTGKIFEQMSSVMLDIQEAGCMFPDAKITNWLVDEDNKIRLADTKSFLFTDKNGNYHSGIPGNEYCGFLSTPSFTPPDFGESSMSSDSVHAYILGKNLYYYTSGKLGKGDDGAKYDFSGQFFKTKVGPEYKEIIEGLIKPNPSERMPVREALDRLFMINNPEFKDVFTDLKKLKFGENDKIMNDYIRDKQKQINSTTNLSERDKILKELETTVSNLQKDNASKEVKDVINGFRERDGLFTVGMKAKATRIENEMSKLSIEERCNFFGSDKSQQVLKAIASHRHWGKGGKTYITKEGDIDQEKAAQSFKDFKMKFQAQIEAPKQQKKEEYVKEKRSLKY